MLFNSLVCWFLLKESLNFEFEENWCLQKRQRYIEDDWLTHLLTHSLIHSLIHSFIYWLSLKQASSQTCSWTIRWFVMYLKPLPMTFTLQVTQWSVVYNDWNYFPCAGRFDEAVIEERRQSALALLNFVGTQPHLYKSHLLARFLAVRTLCCMLPFLWGYFHAPVINLSVGKPKLLMTPWREPALNMSYGMCEVLMMSSLIVLWLMQMLYVDVYFREGHSHKT